MVFPDVVIWKFIISVVDHMTSNIMAQYGVFSLNANKSSKTMEMQNALKIYFPEIEVEILQKKICSVATRIYEICLSEKHHCKTEVSNGLFFSTF